MEKIGKVSSIPMDHIRGLLVAQGGRCAITGTPLDPTVSSADHITPLSRVELAPTMDKDNVWVVHKSVNTVKGNMTYDELIEMARKILDHHQRSMSLLQDIRARRIAPLSKEKFDQWVLEHCNGDGSLKLP